MKRVRGPDAVGDLQQHSKQLRMMGQDPLPATLHQAQLAGLHQGPFSQVRTTYQNIMNPCTDAVCVTDSATLDAQLQQEPLFDTK